MKLINKAIEKRFAEVGSQDGLGDEALVIVKFFNPTGRGTWYATELDEYSLINAEGHIKTVGSYEERLELEKQGYEIKDIRFFGYVSIFGDHNDEWGSFVLSELQEYKGAFGLGIERDLYSGERKLKDYLK